MLKDGPQELNARSRETFKTHKCSTTELCIYRIMTAEFLLDLFRPLAMIYKVKFHAFSAADGPFVQFLPSFSFFPVEHS